jgi:spore coat polysaccharide biosynthesis protein SpsF
MKITAIVQARMGSTRLPGKVLKDLGGETTLGRVVRRLRRSELIEEVVIATTFSPDDQAVVLEARRLGVPAFMGDELDVLDRFYQASRAFQPELVVRITSDCPLIDPQITDSTIRAFLDASPDYASNAFERTYPRGLDTEVMTPEALGRAWRQAKLPYQREHVTPFIYEHPELFRILPVTNQEDYSSHRWTLDTPEDLEFLRTVYERFDNRDDFSWRDVLDLLAREPALVYMNAHIEQKVLHEV